MTQTELESILFLVDELKACDGVERPEIAARLVKYGPVATSPLGNLLSHTNWEVRYWAVKSLAGIGDSTALQQLAAHQSSEQDRFVGKTIRNALAAKQVAHARGLSGSIRTADQSRSRPVSLPARVKYPTYSRQQLAWSIFEECAHNEWRLVLPNYYAWLYFTRHSTVRSKSHTGWRDTQNGRHQFAFFRDLSPQDIQRTQNFITAYRQPVIIGLNDHIRPHFSHELDACLCLDFNMAESSSGEFVRTKTGELEYLAKYQQSVPAVDSLLNRLVRGVNLMPIANMVNPVVPFTLTYIPPEPTKQFHLPRVMAHRLAQRLAHVEQERRWLPCVDATLTGPKISLKGATLEQKIAEWQRLVSSEMIQLSAPVDGLAVFILDDLYQSGVTMWTYARYLKSVGARWVFGLTCVKSLRDTDNV